MPQTLWLQSRKFHRFQKLSKALQPMCCVDFHPATAHPFARKMLEKLATVGHFARLRHFSSEKEACSSTQSSKKTTIYKTFETKHANPERSTLKVNCHQHATTQFHAWLRVGFVLTSTMPKLNESNRQRCQVSCPLGPLGSLGSHLQKARQGMRWAQGCSPQAPVATNETAAQKSLSIDACKVHTDIKSNIY